MTEFEIGMILQSIVAVVSFSCTFFTIYLIIRMRNNGNGYVKLVMLMTAHQCLLDLGYMIAIGCRTEYGRINCVNTEFFFIWFGAFGLNGYANALIGVFAWTIVTQQISSMSNAIVGIMFLCVSLPSLILAVWGVSEKFNSTAFSTFGIILACQCLLSCIFAVTLASYLWNPRVNRNLKPFYIVAKRLSFYAANQIICEIFVICYAIIFQSGYQDFSSPSNKSALSLYLLASILAPSAGILNLIVFIAFQPEAKVFIALWTGCCGSPRSLVSQDNEVPVSEDVPENSIFRLSAQGSSKKALENLEVWDENSLLEQILAPECRETRGLSLPPPVNM